MSWSPPLRTARLCSCTLLGLRACVRSRFHPLISCLRGPVPVQLYLVQKRHKTHHLISFIVASSKSDLSLVFADAVKYAYHIILTLGYISSDISNCYMVWTLTSMSGPDANFWFVFPYDLWELPHCRQIHKDWWWHHHMESISSSLALFGGNSPVTSGFPSQRASSAELWPFPWCMFEEVV